MTDIEKVIATLKRMISKVKNEASNNVEYNLTLDCGEHSCDTSEEYDRGEIDGMNKVLEMITNGVYNNEPN